MDFRKEHKRIKDLIRTLEHKAPREGRDKRDRRAAIRNSALPPDRVCPLCNKIKLSSRSWVVGKHAQYDAICRSCFYTLKAKGFEL